MIPFYQYDAETFQSYSMHHLTFPPHLHGYPELVRVRKGYLTMQIGKKECIIRAGELAVIFPNMIHSYQMPDKPTNTIIDLLICGKSTMGSFPEKFISAECKSPVIALPALHPDVDYAISALLAESLSDKNPRVINAYLQILWARVIPCLKPVLPSSVMPDVATSLITYITEHFCEPLSLELLSKKFGAGRFYISRIFSGILHIGFYEYVNALRIEQAKKLLTDSADSILNIAMQCGFQSQQTFNRVFKEICGQTPREYRKQSE